MSSPSLYGTESSDFPTRKGDQTPTVAGIPSRLVWPKCAEQVFLLTKKQSLTESFSM